MLSKIEFPLKFELCRQFFLSFAHLADVLWDLHGSVGALDDFQKVGISQSLSAT